MNSFIAELIGLGEVGMLLPIVAPLVGEQDLRPNGVEAVAAAGAVRTSVLMTTPQSEEADSE